MTVLLELYILYCYNKCWILHVQWTTEEMRKEGPYKKQTSAERKEALYHDIIDYFSRGKVI